MTYVHNDLPASCTLGDLAPHINLVLCADKTRTALDTLREQNAESYS